MSDRSPSLRRFVLPALFVAGLFVTLWLRRPPAPSSRLIDGQAMGTTWSVRVPAGTDVVSLRPRIESAIAGVNQSMSTYVPESELSRFNRTPPNEPMEVSEGFLRVLAEALRVGKISGGAFDVTVGPVVKAWGFGPNPVLTPPTDSVLAAARARMGQDELSIGKGTVRRARADIDVDLSAIAKGYAVDVVVDMLVAAGLSQVMVELGGEVRVVGTRPGGGAWNIGVERPDGGAQEVWGTLPIRDMAVATSGDYRNVVQVGERRVSHTIDGRTGRPVAHGLGSVTVVHRQCMTADALATALMALGPDEGKVLAEREGVATIFMERLPSGELRVWRSKAMLRLLENRPDDPA